jgi:dephospho-CoA kinase
MKRIGLTGNIGTGKTTIARIFEVLGVPVYHADTRARVLLDSDTVKHQVASLFGNQVINPMNQVDRKALANIVFNDKEKLAELNNLIHPLVEEDFAQWCETHKNEHYILHEAAILFESGFNRLFDSTIMVAAPDELCIERVMARDGITKEMVIERMQNQWPQEKKMELSEYVVVNNNHTLVIPQVIAIHKAIRSKE